jgi:hypothetical protein
MPSVDEEIALLEQEIKRLGVMNNNGQYEVTYGVLFKDEQVANTFEALLGTLKAAKKRKRIHFEGELLLQGVHDHVLVTLLKQ